MKFNLTAARDLVDLAKKLTVGLTKLTIEDNMENFKVTDLTIEANSVVTIRNKLTFIPSQYIITSQEGNALITKTGTWSKEFLSLRNNNASNDAVITIIFMR